MERSLLPSRQSESLLSRAAIPALLLFLLAAGIAAPVQASPAGPQDPGSWLKTFPAAGAAGGNAIAGTADGGTLVTGAGTDAQGHTLPLVLKTDGSGLLQWMVTAGDPACRGAALQVQSPAAAAVLADCRDASGDAVLTLLDPADGRVTGSHSYDVNRHTAVTAMAAEPGGGSVLAEEADTTVIGASGREIVVRRIGSQGEPVWDRTFPGLFSGAPGAVLAGPDGSIAIAGPVARQGGSGTGTRLLLLDGTGREIGRQTPDTGSGGTDVPSGIAPDGKGGYFIAGTSCTGGTCRIAGTFAAKDGTPAGVYRSPGPGNESAASVVAAPDGGYTMVGTTQGAGTGGTDRDILVLHVDGTGTERWRRTIGTPADETAAGAALAADGALLITGTLTSPGSAPVLFIARIGNGGTEVPAGLLKQEPAPNPAGSLTVRVRDATTGSNLPGAVVYYDGKLAGTTSPPEGTFSLPDQAAAPRTVRVTMEGYREQTVPVTAGTGPELTIDLQPSPVHRILGAGTPEDSLDIVFVPSDTSYDCTLRQKVPADRYVASREAFVNDVRRIAGNTLLRIPAFAASPDQIPQDYLRKINIYYYWDGSSYADAFNGCAGSLPSGFWDDVPYAEVAVILYPSYGGVYSGSSCEPQGCTNGIGAGLQSWMKVPADKDTLFMHESGHALFGLMDTYCGDTFYAENLPDPNLWRSLQNCTEDASGSGWNVSLCRPLDETAGGQAASCTGAFWKHDPAPDLMGSTSGGARYGEASERRIQYVFSTVKGA